MPLDLLTPARGGLHCAAGGFCIDPLGEVEPVSVVTHAHSDHARAVADVVHCSREGERVLRRRVGDGPEIVAHEWGERFRLGKADVSLHPAGHIRGSAQVRVQADGETWVVSGDYKRESDPTCTPFEVVPCDVFVTEATFALPIYRWLPTEVVVQQIYEWWQDNAARGRCSMLFCYALGKAQRVLAGLRAHTERPVYVHGAVEPLTEAYREDGVEMLPTMPIEERKDGFVGELVMAPPSASRSPWMRRFKNVQTGFASGWMRVRGVRRGRGWDRGFVLSDHADWPGIVETVAATGARRLLVHHGRADALLRYFSQRDVQAASFHAESDRSSRAVDQE
ncbi:MAG: ligase-associated DNA damage response exonuclease [Planctomycetota bacterium]